MKLPGNKFSDAGLTTARLNPQILIAIMGIIKMDLNTLFGFGEDLTPEEIGEFCRKLAQKAGNYREIISEIRNPWYNSR